MTQAAAWYRKAADQGDADAQATLGVLYSVGQGVELSNADAYFWLDLAADVSGPNQEKYAAERQMVGQHITADEPRRCAGSRGQVEGDASSARTLPLGAPVKHNLGTNSCGCGRAILSELSLTLRD